jgi:penicillin-binding protein-related factor A (putative recombinase)
MPDKSSFLELLAPSSRGRHPVNDLSKPKTDKPEKKKGPAAWGNKFQKEIQEACNIYQELKIAYIQQFAVPTAFVPGKNGAKGFLIHRQKTGFDFIGGIVRTKEAIFIEAKTTEHGTIDVWQEKSGIKTHQLNEMLWLESVGFQCWFFWQIRNANNVVYKLTPRKIVELIGTTKTLNLMMCDEARIPKLLKTGYRGKDIYDFLGELS